MINANASRPTPDPAPARDDSAVVAEMMMEIATLSMVRVRLEHDMIVASAKAGDIEAVCALERTFAQVNLGIRRALAFKAKLERQHQKVAEKEDAVVAERRQARRQQEREVAAAVDSQIQGADPAIEKDQAERLLSDLYDRMETDEDLIGDLERLPFKTVIRRLCEELGIPFFDPDEDRGYSRIILVRPGQNGQPDTIWRADQKEPTRQDPPAQPDSS